MFVVHDDMTIYATRGDVVYFSVEKKQGDAKYLFQPGDIVRIKVCEKKNYAKVFLLKDFEVEEASTSVNIFLNKHEMKFGEIINKPTDYWYEVELNPDTYPDTFIGHNENGPAIFKLFPEAKDVVDGEIPDPEENSAVSRMVVHFVNEYLGDKADTIIQEILKKEYLDIIVNEIKKEENIGPIIQEILKENNVETIVQEIIRQESLETIVQEIVKTEHVETIVQEIVKPENAETIVQEIIKEENLRTIVNEILTEENIQVIVDRVLEEVPGNMPGNMIVTVDSEAEEPTTNYSAAQIIAHIENGGSAVLKLPGSLTTFASLFSIVGDSVGFCEVLVLDGIVNCDAYLIEGNTITTESYTVEQKASDKQAAQIQANTEAIAGIQAVPTAISTVRDGQTITMTLSLEGGSTETHVLTLDSNDYPTSLSVNGRAIPLEWSGFDG